MSNYRHILVKDWRIRSTDPPGEAWATSGTVSVIVHEALPNQSGPGGSEEPLPSHNQKEAGE